MKIQMDTVEKTIKIESNIKLSELVDTLEKLLPKGLWKEFTLENNTVINNWTSPIIIRDYYPKPYWERPYYYCTNAVSSVNVGSNDYQLRAGTFSIEC